MYKDHWAFYLKLSFLHHTSDIRNRRFQVHDMGKGQTSLESLAERNYLYSVGPVHA